LRLPRRRAKGMNIFFSSKTKYQPTSSISPYIYIYIYSIYIYVMFRACIVTGKRHEILIPDPVTQVKSVTLCYLSQAGDLSFPCVKTGYK